MKNSSGFTSYLCMVLAIIVSSILFLTTLKETSKKIDEVKQSIVKSSVINIPVR